MGEIQAVFEEWLRKYGPLWVNGIKHIVVIAGIQGHKSGDSDLLIYDPWPVGAGVIQWRSLKNWYALGDDEDSRDTRKSVEAIFLYIPE